MQSFNSLNSNYKKHEWAKKGCIQWETLHKSCQGNKSSFDDMWRLGLCSVCALTCYIGQIYSINMSDNGHFYFGPKRFVFTIVAFLLGHITCYFEVQFLFW